MMIGRRILLAVVAVALLAGCGSDDEKKAPAPKPEPEKARFVPDAEPTDGALFLRERAVDDEVLVLDIVAQGTPPLYGVAFRLETEAGVLELADLVDETPFAGGVAGAVEARPGLIVVTYSRVGDQPGVDDDTLGAIRLRRAQPTGASVRFVAEESQLFDAEAKPLSGTTFIGGTLVVP